MCDRGVMVPFTIDQWNGLMLCSACGQAENPDRTGCLACGQWFPTEQAWLEHRPGCPGLDGVCIEHPTGVVPQGTPAPISGSSNARATGRQKYIQGGRCRRGHLLTKQTLYRSPRGVVRCEACRKEKARKPH